MVQLPIETVELPFLKVCRPEKSQLNLFGEEDWTRNILRSFLIYPVIWRAVQKTFSS